MNKWDFIDWKKTKQKFGYASKKLKATDHVIVQCCQCSAPIEIRYDSVRDKKGKSYQPICRSCNSKKQWENQEYKQNISIKTSLSMKKVWNNKEYVHNQREKHKISGKQKWQDDEYRKRVKSGVKKAHANDQEYTKSAIAAMGTKEAIIARKKALQQKRKCKDYRDKLSQASRDNWNNLEYRKKMMSILTSKEFRQKQIKTHNTTEYKEKAATTAQSLWEQPEHREKMIAIWNKPEYKEKMAVARASQSNRISSIQLQLYKYLDDFGLEYHKEGTETAIGYYVFDCLIPKQGEMRKHVLIECQGDYWHSLSKSIRNDKSKFTYINRYFPKYEIMYVWEHEFSAKDRVFQRLQLKLGINIDTIDFNFNDVQIKEVSGKDIKSFLDAYHYIGKGRGGKCFGAYLNDELIACIIFSSPLRQNTAYQFNLIDSNIRELSRLCIHPSYHKKNFASWVISRTIKNIKEFIIAYADTTVGHDGTIYKAANFRLHHEVAPDYWYVDGDGYVMHKRTLYGRACKMKMKESDFAEKYGYFKKWGGKKLCFIYSK